VTVDVVDAPPARAPHSATRMLKAIGYDPVDDVVLIAAGGRRAGDPVVLRHFIFAPRSIDVEEARPLQPHSILVEDASGVCTRISLFVRPAASACGSAARRLSAVSRR